jgi:hypothetical protein
MKLFHIIVLAIVFAFATAAPASASDIHGDCCDGIECPMDQCMDFGCLSLAGQQLIGSSVAPILFAVAPYEAAAFKFRIPTTVKEVWTPPD